MAAYLIARAITPKTPKLPAEPEPPPEPPAPPPRPVFAPEVDASAEEAAERVRIRRRRGVRATILTSPLGVTGDTTRDTLGGG